MREIKNLKYSITTKNEFKGIPFFRRLAKVRFLESGKTIAELEKSKNNYLILFDDSEKIQISFKKTSNPEFKIHELSTNTIWQFSNSNTKFSFFKDEPVFLKDANSTQIKIKTKHDRQLFYHEEQLIGIIENKYYIFKNGELRIAIFNKTYRNILISVCCITVINYHILKTHEI